MKDPRKKRPKCRQCPRFKEGVYVPPKIIPGGPLIIAESPGQSEIAPVDPADREPLIGPSGAVLNRLLDKAGLHRSGCSLVNTAQCGLPGRDEVPDALTMECCAGIVNEVMRKAKPTVVIAAGGASLLRLTGLPKITEWMGSVLEVAQSVVVGSKKAHLGAVYKSGKKKGQPKLEKVDVVIVNEAAGTPVIPVLHPASVLYERFRTAPIVIEHLRRARMIHEGEPLVSVADAAEPGFDKVSDIEPYMRADTLVLDIEAGRDGGPVTIIGLARDAHHAIAIHPSQTAIRALKEWCADPSHTLIAHNATYDMGKLEELGIDVRCAVWDTFHAVQYERPDIRSAGGAEGWNRFAALDVVASRLSELDYVNWKQRFREALDPDEPLYCKRDCCVTWYVYERIREKLKKTGRLKHFESTLMPLLKILHGMKKRGVRIDTEALDRMIRAHRNMSKRLWAVWEEEMPGINVTQTKRLMDYYYDEVGLKVQYTGRGKKRRRTLDRDAIEKLAELYPERRELAALRSVRHVDKVLNTYLMRIADGLDGDNRFHFEYNLSGTWTGRLSSDAQQFPRPDANAACPVGVQGCACTSLRKLIVADTPGDRVIAADYSQIEAIITAIVANEEWLVESFQRPDFDYHTETGEFLAERIGGEFAKLSAKERRTLGKRANHATNYQMSWPGIMKHFGCDKQTAIEIEQAIHDLRPATVSWWKEVERQIRTKGYVANPWGRRAYFVPYQDSRGGWKYDTPKAVAFIPQSSAFEVIAGAMIRAHEAGLSLMIQAHDELVISEEYEDDADILKECMEYAVEELGGWRFKADIGVGKTWWDAKLDS
ncbi:MAG: hypothetical protein D6812_15360 [Deltaproteobacteria bacterium]|nr:MAG: hypothetical protein D6812_15360 [Deltaproteobacteria bacterium]